MKIKKHVIAFLVGLFAFSALINSVQAATLPDLVINQLTIDRIEWRQMPDCDHNACQNLIWKALFEFHLTVQNQGQAPAQIPNGNFESSGVLDTLIHKSDNRVVSQVQNWETVPNPLAAGQAVQLFGRMYINENDLKLREEYLLCSTITGRPSDNQNWFLQESNVKNNTFCHNFFLDIPTHTNPNPRVVQINVPSMVWRNADRSVDVLIIYTVQNATPGVYVSNFGRHITVKGNWIESNFCPGNISPGMHGGEMQNVVCAVHLPPGTAPGIYSIKVVLDEANRITESNELDNVMEKQIQIL